MECNTQLHCTDQGILVTMIDFLLGAWLAWSSDFSLQDVAQVLAKEFPKQIDVAYEGVGGKLRDAVLANLASKGRVLAVGYISEYPHNQKR